MKFPQLESFSTADLIRSESGWADVSRVPKVNKIEKDKFFMNIPLLDLLEFKVLAKKVELGEWEAGAP